MDRRHPARLIRHAAQRTCRRSMRTATAALGTTMSRPSSLAGSHRVSLPISSQGAARDCALSLTWSGRAAENAGLLKRQHRSRSQRRFPEDAFVANVGCRRVSPVRRIPAIVSFLNPQPALRLVSGNRSSCPNAALAPGETEGLRRVENNVLVSARYGRPRARVDALPDAQGVSDPSRSKEVATAEIVDCEKDALQVLPPY